MRASLAIFAALVAYAAASGVPLFVWSGHSNAAEQGASSSTAALTNLIQTGKNKPEVVMVYVLDKTSTYNLQQSQAALTHIQGLLRRARSTSFAAVGDAGLEGLKVVAEHQNAKFTEVSSAEVQPFLAKHASMMSDGKTDVVVVRFPKGDIAEGDALIGATESAVAAGTSGKSAGIVTSSGAGAGRKLLTATPYNPSYNEFGSVNNKRMYYGGVSLLTSNLLLAIGVCLFMVFVWVCAVCCLTALQTPEMFEGDQKRDMDRALENPGARK